jgi:Domain of unknown function (DUF4142)
VGSGFSRIQQRNAGVPPLIRDAGWHRSGDEAGRHTRRQRDRPQFNSRGTENVAQLSKLHGAAFDRASIAHEVAYHQQVLDTLDKTLIPNASNEQPKRCCSR